MTTDPSPVYEPPWPHDAPPDTIDRWMSESWIQPPPGFEQRVLAAALAEPMQQRATPTPQRRSPWGWLGDLLLVVTGLGGLTQALGLVTAAWLTTVAGG